MEQLLVGAIVIGSVIFCIHRVRRAWLNADKGCGNSAGGGCCGGGENHSGCAGKRMQ